MDERRILKGGSMGINMEMERDRIVLGRDLLFLF